MRKLKGETTWLGPVLSRAPSYTGLLESQWRQRRSDWLLSDYYSPTGWRASWGGQTLILREETEPWERRWEKVQRKQMWRMNIVQREQDLILTEECAAADSLWIQNNQECGKVFHFTCSAVEVEHATSKVFVPDWNPLPHTHTHTPSCHLHPLHTKTAVRKAESPASVSCHVF